MTVVCCVDRYAARVRVAAQRSPSYIIYAERPWHIVCNFTRQRLINPAYSTRDQLRSGCARRQYALPPFF